MRRLIPSPAMVVACLALVLSLGGVSYAASRIGTKDIANSAITSVKIKDGAVRPADLSASSLAALSVRAYTYVTWEDPVILDPARTRGFASVVRVKTGVYCLTYADDSIDPDTVAPAVSVDWDKSAGANLAAYLSKSAAGCPEGSDLGVRTFTFTAGGSYKLANAVAFTVVVP
ncbi:MULTISPECIES: hypothetical protein [unclassified Nocardioides]|uniref:hypothetical protein n=1 Tax=unclassified Nocardioides TaxID=2615069 RepID=UPI0000EB6365|nr:MULTISPECIES: hypothetical protein [unclassified Nocardioides]ABL83225.1 hypothetical protein Noca_3725 [Nocardioides sp. JS614]